MHMHLSELSYIKLKCKSVDKSGVSDRWEQDCVEKAQGDFKVWMDMLEPDTEGSNP